MGSPLFGKAVNGIKMRYMYLNELYHYGIRGQKWGIRRFQNPDGTLTPAGKRRYGTVENLERGITKNEAEQREIRKQAAIKSGRVDEVRAYRNEMTQEELNQAIANIRTSQTLDQLKASEISTGEAALQRASKALDTTYKALDSGKKLYNIAAEVNNAFNKEHQWSIIGKEASKPNADELTKLFNLEQSKKKAAREEEVEELLRTKDLDWFKKHSDEFTKEELGKAIGRNELFESEKWTGKEHETETIGPVETAIKGSSGGKSKSGKGNKTDNGSSFVKDNFGGEKPFSAFKTIPHYSNGGKVDFNGLVFEKVFSSRESAYKAYMDEHPNSKLTENEFMSWFKEN